MKAFKSNSYVEYLTTDEVIVNWLCRQEMVVPTAKETAASRYTLKQSDVSVSPCRFVTFLKYTLRGKNVADVKKNVCLRGT